jgi:Domain of Unknown Function (DUF1080)
MSHAAAAGFSLLALTFAFADEPSRVFRFTKADEGKLPAGWEAAHTGKGDGSIWKVVADPSGPSKTGYVLAQLAQSPSRFFNLCVVLDADYRDLAASVAFKAMRGKEDQGGGIVWRYQDGDNYYLARMNPLEDNYRVYKVVHGKRTQLGTREGLKIPAGEWHTLRIQMQGDRIQCALDGETMLDVRDHTFPKSGKTGLWTKSDAQTHFDGFRVTAK